MELVIGGYAQGKLNFVLQKNNPENCLICDGMLPDEKQLQKTDIQGKTVIINHFHEWIKKRLLLGENPEEEIIAFSDKKKECIIISDEIGNGIVPIDAFEREYRERTGRILVRLASEADEVVRVVCGIGQKIK